MSRPSPFLLSIVVLLLVSLLVPAFSHAAPPPEPPAARATQYPARIAGYNGQPAGGTLLALPAVARGTAHTTIYVHNPNDAAASVILSFYDQAGAVAVTHVTSIPTHGTLVLPQLPMSDLPLGFEGSAMLESTLPVVAIVNVESTAVDVLLSYEGIAMGDLAVYLPDVLRQYYNWSSDLWVQNLSVVPATIGVNFYSPSGDLAHSLAGVIPAFASAIYRVDDISELGTGLFFTVVQADQPVAAVVQSWNPQPIASAYVGLGSPTDSLVAPWQLKSPGWHAYTKVQNVSLTPVSMSTSWYDEAGSHLTTLNASLGAYQAIDYTPDTVPGLPDFAGAVHHESTGYVVGRNAVTVTAAGTGDVNALFSTFPASSAGYSSFLPHLSHALADGIYDEFAVQNVGTGPATIDLSFYDLDGSLAYVFSDTIPVQGTAYYSSYDLAALGSDWQGAAAIESSAPVVAQVLQFITTIPDLPADLALTLTDDLDPVTLDELLTYRLTLANAGPGDATGVTVVDTLPAGVAFDSASSSQGTCQEISQTVTCDLGTLAVGMTATVSIVLTPTTPVTVTNTAQAGATELDPLPGNNLAAESTAIVTGAVSIVDPTLGATLVYTATDGATTVVDVPPGAVDQETRLVFAPVDELPDAAMHLAGQQPFVRVDLAFDLRAYWGDLLQPQFHFSLPISGTIFYREVHVQDVDELTLKLLRLTPNGWDDAAIGDYRRSADLNRLELPLRDTGRFSLFALPLPPSFPVYLPVVLRTASHP